MGIVSVVMVVFEQFLLEFVLDIFVYGMVLIGGGVLLKDLDCLLMEEIGILVVVVDDLLICVVCGGGKVLEMIDMYGGDVFSYD